MGLEDLLERMHRESEQQVAAVLAEARAAAERSVQEAQAAIAWERSKRLANQEQELQAESEAALNHLRRAARQETLATRREAVDRILERARALSPELGNDSRYLERIEAELDRALEALGGPVGRLTVSSGLADRLRTRLSQPAEVVRDDSDVGFRLQSADGRIEVRQTIGEQLRRLAPALRIAAAAALDREP